MLNFHKNKKLKPNEYGFEFCIKHGFDPYGMANALEKLNNLSEGQKASKFQQMFSSHPDSAKRASRMKEKADAYLNK